MAFGGGSGKGPKNDINVTPLVDVVLVLLIIFMVITPMLQRGKDVHLPKANKQADEKKSADPLVISVTVDKQAYVESQAVSDEELTRMVAEELQKQPGRKLLLKGDDRLTVGDVRRVMKRAQSGGAKGVALGIEEIKQ